MIVSATAGRTRAKIVVDAPELTVSSAAPIDVSLATGSVHGAFSMADADRISKIDFQVSMIVAQCDVFVATQLWETNEMHRYFLGRLQMLDADWQMLEGTGGNHLLIRSSEYSGVRVDNFQMPGGRPMSDFTVRHRGTGFEFHVLAVRMSEDTPWGSEEADRAQQYAFVAQRAAGLRYVVAAGDWQFSTEMLDGPGRTVLAGAGLTGLQSQIPLLPYGSVDSDDGGPTGRWVDDILTREDDVVLGAASGVATNGISDHYLWVSTIVGFKVDAVDPSLKMTVTRQSGGTQTVLPSARLIPARSMVITDHAVPLARDVTYTVTLSDGSQPVLSNVIRVGASLCLLTHVVTGAVAECWIQTWPERTFETPSTLVKVPGRRSPVVLTDVEGLASSQPVLLTATQAQEAALDDLVDDGEVLLLRTLTPHIPDAYLSLTGRTTRRFAEFKPDSEVRQHTLTAQEIGAEDMWEAGIGESLADIAAALPGGTLDDLANLFPGGTLLDVAANDWTALA